MTGASDKGMKVKGKNSYEPDQAVTGSAHKKSFDATMNNVKTKTENKETDPPQRQNEAVDSGKSLPPDEVKADEKSGKTASQTVKADDDTQSEDGTQLNELVVNFQQIESNPATKAATSNKTGDMRPGTVKTVSGQSMTEAEKKLLEENDVTGTAQLTQSDGMGNHKAGDSKNALASMALSLNKEANAVSPALQGESAMDGGIKGLDKLLSLTKTGNDVSTVLNHATVNSTPSAVQASTALPLSTSLQTVGSGVQSSATALYQAVIHESVGQGDWGQSMSKQIVWMASQNIRSAELKLNPANLGTIEVRIGIDDKNINVAFGSQHLHVRDAIEQSMPRLREMMAEQGLNLNNPDVSQQAFSQHQNSAFMQNQQPFQTFPGREEKLDDSVENIISNRMQAATIADTAVDYYI